MAIKIKCIICDEEIIRPKTDQLYCSNESCKKQFETNMLELQEMEENGDI